MKFETDTDDIVVVMRDNDLVLGVISKHKIGTQFINYTFKQIGDEEKNIEIYSDELIELGKYIEKLAN